MEKVNKSGPVPSHVPHVGPCWIWEGTINPNGVPYFSIGQKSYAAHRAGYELLVGPIPKDRLLMHPCDVKICVNPSHLRPGTQTDNMRDMVEKGRNRPSRGENNPHAKLRTEDVLKIKNGLARGETQTALAIIFGVHRRTVGMIKLGQRWKHLP